jgi:hypothetical protein
MRPAIMTTKKAKNPDWDQQKYSLTGTKNGAKSGYCALNLYVL